MANLVSQSTKQVPIFRQTRATTRKRVTLSDTETSSTPSTSTTSTTTTTTPQPSPTPQVASSTSSSESAEEDSEKPAKLKPKRKKKKLEPEQAKATEEEEKELEEQDKLKRKKVKPHPKNSTIVSSTSSTTSASTSTTPETVTESSSSEPKSTSSTSTPRVVVSTESSKKSSVDPDSVVSSTAATTSKTPKRVHHPASNHSQTSTSSPVSTSTTVTSAPAAIKKLINSTSDHEYYDDDADEEELQVANKTRKPSDLSAIKLVGLNKWNESVAANHSNASDETKLNLIDDQPNSSPLGARSPSSIVKKISSIIADPKSKHHQRQSTSNSALHNSRQTSSTSKFAYSNPPTTSTMMTPVERNDSMLVQIINQTEPSSNLTLNSSLHQHLDWSKFVKVVFKSAKDNHTIYTVVVNSSELASHPINDWSLELPKLLQRDFENLIEKWSNVFPIDHLMSDLSKIFISKVSSSSPVANSSLTSSLISKLNETFRLQNSNQTATMIPAINKTLISTNLTVSNSLGNVSNITQTPIAPINPISNSTIFNRTIPEAMLSNNSFTLPSPNRFHGSLSFNKSAKASTPKSDLTYLNETAHQELNRSANVTSANSKTLTGQQMINSALERANDTFSNNNNNNNTTTSSDQSNKGNRSAFEMIKDMNSEHAKIEDNLKQQADSLRHFIIVCSVSTVLATSIVVGLILVLTR